MKSVSQKERDEFAKELKSRRSEYAKERAELEKRRGLIGKQFGGYERKSSELDVQRAELVKNFGELSGQIEELRETSLDSMLNFFKIRALRANILSKESQKGTVTEELKIADSGRATMRSQLEKVIGELRANKDSQTKWQSEALARFYVRRVREWESAPYTPEEVAELFTEEHLSELSMEDYVLLLKRFPSEMISHVSRHGVRDHTGHMWHRSGVGEYNKNFLELLADGRLKSIISRIIQDGLTKEAVIKHLNLNSAKNRKEVLVMANDIFRQVNAGGGGSYEDISAVHLAAEEVADSCYGAEKGNEAFVVFPSVFIDSQYGYRGNLSKSGGGYWNDQWVFESEQEGVGLDAGIVFLPGEVEVGRETGSRYEVIDGKAVVNERYVKAIGELINHPKFDEVMGEILSELGKASFRPSQGLVDRLRERVMDELGIEDEKLARALTNHDAASKLLIGKSFVQKTDDRDMGAYRSTFEGLVSGILQKAGIEFVLASDTVPAREYWESVFMENSGTRPSRVVYYAESDPTQALCSWRQSNGLLKKTELDFQKHGGDFTQSGLEMRERFSSVLTEAIDYLFPPEDDPSLPPPLPMQDGDVLDDIREQS